MRHILVASDLSARSDRALERAVLLARQHQARVTVLHVVDEDLPGNIADQQVRAGEISLATTIAALPGMAVGDCQPLVVVGEHYQTIVSEADRLDANLIVLGQHRKDVFLDLFRGSTGERIVRFGTRPVLIVKTRPVLAYSNLLAAVDFSPPCRTALEFAVELAPQAGIKFAHAYSIPFRGVRFSGPAMEQLAKKHQQQFQDMIDNQTREFLASIPTPIQPRQIIAREGRPDDVVVEIAEETHADLLVVGTHGRSGLGRALLGSVAENVLARAPCDVLAVRGW